MACDPETLVSGFSVVRVPPFPKRWNIAPQSEVPVVRETREGERVAELLRWGLVPHWARDPAIGHRLNNARSDGRFDKPSFRQAVRRRRCLLPASGFFGWQALGDVSGPKQPKHPWYLSSRDGAPPAMAGVFQAWRSAEDAPWLVSCCIVTVAANALVAPVRERMPALLAREDWAVRPDRQQQEPAVLATPLQPRPAG